MKNSCQINGRVWGCSWAYVYSSGKETKADKSDDYKPSYENEKSIDSVEQNTNNNLQEFSEVNQEEGGITGGLESGNNDSEPSMEVEI